MAWLLNDIKKRFNEAAASIDESLKDDTNCGEVTEKVFLFILFTVVFL